jgi:hypothetical protein
MESDGEVDYVVEQLIPDSQGRPKKPPKDASKQLPKKQGKKEAPQLDLDGLHGMPELKGTTYIHNKPEAEAFKLLIDCFRMRTEDGVCGSDLPFPRSRFSQVAICFQVSQSLRDIDSPPDSSNISIC